MAEEKAEKNEEKKKAGIVRHTLKWFGVGVVCVLLLGAVVFAAPWKVVALLAIILAACTALPKPARKWFWASVGVVILGCILWVFLPESDGDWRPYIFVEELTAWKAKRAIPREENAAVIYNELIDKFDANSFGHFYYGEDSSKVWRDFWLSEDYPEVAGWLEEQQEDIEMLMRASKYKACRFPIDANLCNAEGKPPQNFAELYDACFNVDYLSGLRKGASLLIAAGNNDIAEGRIIEGLTKYRAALQIGQHLRQQGDYMPMLTGAGTERRVYERFKQFLVNKEPREQHINSIGEYLATIEYKWDSDFGSILESEKLSDKSMLCGIAYQTNSEGEIRLNRDPNSTLRKNYPAYPEYSSVLVRVITWKASNNFDRRFTKAEALVCWFLMPSNPKKAGQIVEEGVGKFWKMDGAEPKFRKVYFIPSFNYELFVEKFLYYLLSSCNSVYKSYHEAATEHKGCQLIATLCLYKNIYGRWPETLDEVKEFAEPEMFLDSFNYTPFVYKLTEDDFKLYSVGMNNIDEDDEYKRRGSIHLRGGVGGLDYEEDDILIWPAKSRKAKEENADDEQQ